MKYYEKMLDMKCFNYQNVLGLVGGNTNTAHSLIRSYIEKGYIQTVRRNLYVAISLETADSVANRFVIGSCINQETYISHHSAFEYYGYANQVYYEVYVSSANRFINFDYGGYEYRYVACKLLDGVAMLQNKIRITDMERTIVDSICGFDKIGGLEELLRCLKLVPYVNEKKIADYLRIYDKQIIYQRVGYILEHYQQSLKLSDDFFDFCKKNINKSVRYFSTEIPKNELTFNRQWNLLVPEKLLYIAE